MEKTVSLSEATAEFVIKHSRFISYSYSIESEDDAVEKIASLRKKHFDATHVCYAYIADDKGMVYKCSDDGEPSATAGQPIMSVLKNGGYVKTLIAVVRYFGGTKLGVGGLVKAYTDAATAVEAKAEKITKTFCRNYLSVLDYTLFKKVMPAINACGKIISAEYSENVKFRFCTYDEGLTERLNGICSGRFNFSFEGDGYTEI